MDLMTRQTEELAQDVQVKIPAGDVVLDGELLVPENAIGIVLFAHGSGSSRHSTRNRFVSSVLREGNMATLLFDLLSPDEESIDLHTAQLRFDVAFLAERLIASVDWISRKEQTLHLPIGLFGASTGAGAALVAAAQRSRLVGAVVSRGGRPDLAEDILPMVEAPSLLIVGGRDRAVIELNRRAFDSLRCEKHLEIIHGATHLFEEPGALEQVSALARDWFMAHV
jgi:dienelactone hydrolase